MCKNELYDEGNSEINNSFLQVSKFLSDNFWMAEMAKMA